MSGSHPTSTASRSSERRAVRAGGPRTARSARPGVAAAVLLAVALLAAPVAVGQMPPAAVERAQTEALRRRAAERIDALQREAVALASRERTLLEELRRLEVERDLRTEQYNQSTAELSDVQGQIDRATARIATLEEQARSQLPDLTARLVELYKLGNAGYVRLLLSVDDLRGMGRAYRFVSALQHLDRQRVLEHRRTVEELTAALALLEERRGRLAIVQQNAARLRTEAARAAAAHDALITRIDARRDLNAQLVGELRTAQQRLQQALTRFAQGEAALPEGALILPLRPFRGALDWPVDGRVAGSFGTRRLPRFNTTIVRNGIDIAARADARVTAVHEGTVAYADAFTGFGNLVILDHGGQAYSLYGNLSTMAVALGARVARGQTVGSVGSALDGTSALYFELRIDGRPVDPVQWLKQR